MTRDALVKTLHAMRVDGTRTNNLNEMTILFGVLVAEEIGHDDAPTLMETYNTKYAGQGWKVNLTNIQTGLRLAEFVEPKPELQTAWKEGCGDMTITLPKLSGAVTGAVLAVAVASGQPFQGTVLVSPDVLTEADPTSLTGIAYAGRGEREIFDRRVDAWIVVDAHLIGRQDHWPSHVSAGGLTVGLCWSGTREA